VYTNKTAIKAAAFLLINKNLHQSIVKSKILVYNKKGMNIIE